MIYINTIPYNKALLKKVYLPKNTSSMLKHNVVFLNSSSYNTVINLFNNHPIITKPTNYSRYYVDPMYNEKILNKKVILNYRAERKGVYTKIQEANIGLTPVNTISVAGARNLIYDLCQYNTIFNDTYPVRSTMKKRITTYFNYIKDKLNNVNDPEYKYKMLFCDINEWFSEASKISISTKVTSNNPIIMISYAMYRYPELLSSLGDIDIYMYSTKGIIRINPSMINEKTYTVYKRELNKLLAKIQIDDIEAFDSDENEEDTDDEEVDEPKETGNSTSINQRAEDAKLKYADEPIPEDDDEKLKTDEDESTPEEIDDKTDGLDIMGEDEIESKPEVVSVDEYGEILSTMTDITHARKQERSPQSIQRDKVLKTNQDKLVVKNLTIAECKTYKPDDYKIPEINVSDKVVTTNDNIKTVKFANFDKSYNENLMTKDTINMITHLNDLNIPVYVKSIKVEDTSTTLDYKETYTVVLEDSNRVRHTLKFDMPKFIDGSFMYLGGNKKTISKQMFMKPIVKTGPDEVQICTNYNKIFLTRIGRKVSTQLEKFKKVMSNDIKGVKIIYGDSLSSNNDFKTTLDYDELGKTYYSITTKNMEINFNQQYIHSRLGDMKLPNNVFCIGFYSDGKPILMDYTTEKIGNDDLVTFIISNLGPEASALYTETGAGASKFMYTSAKIMAKPVPLILLLGYCEGLSTVLRKAKIKYHFTDKRPKVTEQEGVVQFADGYLVFERYPFENSLLLNALAYLPTKAYNFTDFNTIEVYLDLFESLYGARQLANAFDTFYEFMIDPISKEILTDLGYPTDFVSVLLCGNAMLADNSFLMENNMNLYRIRSNEIVNAVLYKQIAMAYSRYRATSGNNRPIKISIPQNVVIAELMQVNTVEDHSTLNPFYEVTKTRTASPRGVSGINLDDAYTLPRRMYDKSMLGIVGVSSSPDFNVGINRQLTLEPSIVSARGYIEMKDLDKLTDANLLTPAELLTPGGMAHDDAPRVAMASKQSTHIVPVDTASPVLISNGSDQIIQYHLSTDFVVVASEDGEVVEKDEKAGIMVIKYKSGKYQGIDISSRVAKNSASGFYLSNKLVSDLEVGSKFRAKDIVAYENRFFSNDELTGNRINIGSFQKVAIMSADSTFEDSSFITKKVSNDMATTVIMMKDISIGKNADVDHIVNIGDTVEVGDPLVSFSTSYEDERMNEFLRSVSEEQGQDLKDLSRIQLKSKYGGVIEDIKIYCSVELNELSPSLKTIVTKYYNRINKKTAILNKYDKSKSVVKAGVLLNEPTTKVQTSADGKIKGHEVDGVLIEFYIKYHDVLGVGDKIAYFSAVKSVICDVVPEGYEPFSEFRPDEEVSAFIPPLSIISRMVPSTIQTVIANKILVELKRKLKDIYDS